MKRRDFLKLIGIAPIAPSVLAAIPKEKSLKTIKWSMVGDLSVWDKIADSYKPSNDPFLEVFLNGKEVF